MTTIPQPMLDDLSISEKETLSKMLQNIESTYHLKDILAQFNLQYWIEDCSWAGDNYNSILEFVEYLNLRIPRDECIDELLEWSWTREELEQESTEELNGKYLWLACGQLDETIEEGE